MLDALPLLERSGKFGGQARLVQTHPVLPSPNWVHLQSLQFSFLVSPMVHSSAARDQKQHCHIFYHNVPKNY